VGEATDRGFLERCHGDDGGTLVTITPAGRAFLAAHRQRRPPPTM
jgi:hypothetical protein